MKEQIIWFDRDEWPNASGSLLHGGKARDAGVEIRFSPAADRESALARDLAAKGFEFFYEDGGAPVIPWYALPRLYVFARYGGGFLAWDEPDGADAPVWHIDGEGRVTRAASGLRALMDAIRAGEALSFTPDDAHRLFPSRRAAEAAGELFLRNDTPWR